MNNVPNFIINARDLLRDQKAIIDRVKETKQSAILVTHKEPQVAIIPLEELEELHRLRQKEALKQMQGLADKIAKAHKNNPLPRDLAQNHDRYFNEAYEAQEHFKQT